MTTLTVRKSQMTQAVEQIRTPPAAIREVPSSASDGTQANEIRPQIDPGEDDGDDEEIRVPAHWSKGALLNVRNRGDYYVITLYPEESDPRHPERELRFENTWTCQDFVSRWYARENPDPRAR